MNILRHICIGVMLLLSLASCLDHRLLNADPGVRLKTIDTRVAHIILIYSFNYDASGRLSSLTTRSRPEPESGQLTLLQYDQLGRLVQATTQPKPGLDTRRTNYIYDAAGRLLTVTTLTDADQTGTYRLENELALVYEGVSQMPVKITRNGEIITLNYKEGNVVESKTDYQVTSPTGSYTATDTTTYTYDERLNPLSSVSLALLSTTSVSLRLLSKNNLISTSSKLISTKALLTYEASGRLVKRSNEGLDTYFEETYEYEVY